MPAFYTRPATVAEIVDHTVGRVLNLLGLGAGLVQRWTKVPPTENHNLKELLHDASYYAMLKAQHPRVASVAIPPSGWVDPAEQASGIRNGH